MNHNKPNFLFLVFGWLILFPLIAILFKTIELKDKNYRRTHNGKPSIDDAVD